MPVFRRNQLLQARQPLRRFAPRCRQQLPNPGILIEIRPDTQCELQERADFRGLTESQPNRTQRSRVCDGDGLLPPTKSRDDVRKPALRFPHARTRERMRLGEAKGMQLRFANDQHIGSWQGSKITGPKDIGGHRALRGIGFPHAPEAQPARHSARSEIVRLNPRIHPAQPATRECKAQRHLPGSRRIAAPPVWRSHPIAQLPAPPSNVDVADADCTHGSPRRHLHHPKMRCAGAGIGAELLHPHAQRYRGIPNGYPARVFLTAFEEPAKRVRITGASRPEEHSGVRIPHLTLTLNRFTGKTLTVSSLSDHFVRSPSPFAGFSHPFPPCRPPIRWPEPHRRRRR